MRRLILTFAVAFAVVIACDAAREDERLAQLVVGEWQGGRHAVQYFGDGTWRFDPEEGTTHGTWRIEGGRFVRTWASGDSQVYDIITLDSTDLVLRGPDGTIFKHTRIVSRRSP